MVLHLWRSHQKRAGFLVYHLDETSCLMQFLRIQCADKLESGNTKLTILYEQQQQLLLCWWAACYGAQAIAVMKELDHTSGHPVSRMNLCQTYCEKKPCTNMTLTTPHTGPSEISTAPSTAGTTVGNISIPTQFQTSNTDRAGSFHLQSSCCNVSINYY